VHQVAQLLADEGVNVVDLTTHVIGDEARPVYAMLVDVTIPPSTDSTVVVDRLHTLAAKLGLSCSARPIEPDIL
jgi:glycine cleavage system regulatory protein